VNLKRKLENLEKEIKNLASLINEEDKIVIIRLSAPLHKSDQVIFEDEDTGNAELHFKPEEELSEREIEE